MDAESKKKIRWAVFLPPWIIAISICVLNVTNYEFFVFSMDTVMNWIIANFSWLFNATTCVVLIVILIAYFSPIKNVRFGGSKSKPILSYSNFVWIVLCTIMGSGLLLWACAEPMYHLYYPPANVAAGPLSGEAILWGMENILLEWTFTPMAIYALPTLLFAFAFYNMKKPFSIASMLTPLYKNDDAHSSALHRRVTPVVDCVCLFSLCMGMAASLGVGIMLISSGMEKLSNGAITSNTTVWIICGVIIVVAFIISASSGLMRGIRVLSKINSYFYLILGIFVLLAGPTVYLLELCIESLGAYLSDFFKISLWTSTSYADGWSRIWPTFYWCIWLSWVSVSAIFLGRISRGYTVRETLNVVFVIPSVFSVLWLVIFSGSAINFELAGLGVFDAMQAEGAAGATFAVLENLPFPKLIIPLFLVTAIMSYITSADSNTNAIAGLCTKGLTPDDSESPIIMKIVWGLTIGALCIIMLISYDLNGVRLLSYLGGLPAVFLMILFMLAFIKVMRNPQKYDVYKEDYDKDGLPILSSRLPSEYQERKTPGLLPGIMGRFKVWLNKQRE